MRALRIHEAARCEANEATVRYVEQSLPTGRRLRDELLAAFSRAAGSPGRYPSYLHGTRSASEARSFDSAEDSLWGARHLSAHKKKCPSHVPDPSDPLSFFLDRSTLKAR